MPDPHLLFYTQCYQYPIFLSFLIDHFLHLCMHMRKISHDKADERHPSFPSFGAGGWLAEQGWLQQRPTNLPTDPSKFLDGLITSCQTKVCDETDRQTNDPLCLLPSLDRSHKRRNKSVPALTFTAPNASTSTFKPCSTVSKHGRFLSLLFPSIIC